MGKKSLSISLYVIIGLDCFYKLVFESVLNIFLCVLEIILNLPHEKILVLYDELPSWMLVLAHSATTFLNLWSSKK